MSCSSATAEVRMLIANTIEAAIEHYEDKGQGADVPNHPTPIGCKSVILASAKQTKHQEEEQNRNSELPGKLVEEYANDDNS